MLLIVTLVCVRCLQEACLVPPQTQRHLSLLMNNALQMFHPVRISCTHCNAKRKRKQFNLFNPDLRLSVCII